MFNIYLMSCYISSAMWTFKKIRFCPLLTFKCIINNAMIYMRR